MGYPLGADNYKLDNSPFYAYGVSWEDVVSAPFNSQEGHPTFQRVVSKSGNRTIRVIFETPIETGNESDQLLCCSLGWVPIESDGLPNPPLQPTNGVEIRGVSIEFAARG